MNKIIALWAHPRSLSTAFERMILERGDFFVMHEPFCTLADTGSYSVILPDGKEYTVNSYENLIDLIYEISKSRKIFFKETTDHRYDILLKNNEFLGNIINTFIIREPSKTINSHYAMNNNVTCNEIGYENLYEIFNYVIELTSKIPVVIEADMLISNPKRCIKEYCQRIGINFIDEALTWDSKNISEWKITQKWHIDAMKSIGFNEVEKQYLVRVNNNDKLKEFYDYNLEFYEYIYKYHI
ncbi:hypothetical protein [Clostridium beijerinckii]|uniref:Sulfotransferase family protein n=1 Tax=Clostridium beijerinckii TaxID=1520 RepID=A0AAX0B160_CLOBE|nr:hypothetical protein [Clostridium beijerinckii]NRT88954.1 hypothetical protein [Clostridium beijerinckii]NYC74409.1 hypothetical protein [Clostridium beijerinckii]